MTVDNWPSDISPSNICQSASYVRATFVLAAVVTPPEVMNISAVISVKIGQTETVGLREHLLLVTTFTLKLV